jgi:hypothetical protein
MVSSNSVIINQIISKNAGAIAPASCRRLILRLETRNMLADESSSENNGLFLLGCGIVEQRQLVIYRDTYILVTAF